MRGLALVAVVLAGAAPQEDVRKIAPEAERIKKLARRVPPQGKQKIEKALGAALDAADLAPVLYECFCAVPMVSGQEKTRCLVCILTVQGPKGPVRLGVSVAARDEVLHAVQVLENHDEPVVAAASFLSQFRGFEYGPSIALPAESLAETLKKGAEGKDKRIELLANMNATMRGVGPAWDRMLERLEKKDKTAADEMAAVDRNLDEAVRLSPAIAFLQDTQIDKFKRYASGARTDLGEMKGWVAEGKFAEAYRKAGAIESKHCAQCHGSYRRYFREERAKVGLGDGFFSTELDVAVPDPKFEPSFRAVAAGIRKAILLAAEAK